MGNLITAVIARQKISAANRALASFDGNKDTKPSRLKDAKARALYAANDLAKFAENVHNRSADDTVDTKFTGSTVNGLQQAATDLAITVKGILQSRGLPVPAALTLSAGLFDNFDWGKFFDFVMKILPLIFQLLGH